MSRFRWITSGATALAASRRFTFTALMLAAAAAIPVTAVRRQIDLGLAFPYRRRLRRGSRGRRHGDLGQRSGAPGPSRVRGPAACSGGGADRHPGDRRYRLVRWAAMCSKTAAW